MTKKEQDATKCYVRITLRGKLIRNVSILLHTENFQCVKTILACREKAGVLPNNPYVFGIPSKTNRLIHLDACALLLKFSQLCGAARTDLLRGTELRKHIATNSVLMDLEDNEVKHLVTFLGHSAKIHEDHYRIPIVTREITKISKFLLAAQGDDSDGELEEGKLIIQ